MKFIMKFPTQPVQLPDGMLCNVNSAVDTVFIRSQHPGRSRLDPTLVFTGEDRLRRDLNTLALSEQAQQLSIGTLPTDYPIPNLGPLLPPTAAGRLSRGESDRRANRAWISLLVTAVPFALGVWTLVGFPGQHHISPGQRGAGGGLMVVSLVALCCSPCWWNNPATE